ncbi:Probable lipoprotein transmembrane [Caballeronia glathei]|uniref:Membrane protein n=1 Tax=Caballeronia glathei TaxID=60547 RepID=A0A069PSX7_9BURK|nr:YdcF family protein [Caballeronia glathei]KDR43868.1 membrane protein [Caballeronia glathei]CDY76780.1 Probable lipoprotein transmembrane [Caballeronia glathei]
MLLFFALFALWRRKRGVIAIVCVLLFWALGAGWLSAPLLALAQRGFERTIQPEFAARTTIILMGGGTTRDANARIVPKRDSVVRIQAAAELYRECRRTGAACRVIVSGGDPQHHGQAEADNYAPYLLARGVAATDLTLEDRSLNTYQNARNVAGILRLEHDETLIVVTSAYHMRRSVLAFEAFGFEPQPFVSNVRQVRTTFFPRIDGFVAAETAAHELVGVLRFYVFRLLRLY